MLIHIISLNERKQFPKRRSEEAKLFNYIKNPEALFSYGTSACFEFIKFRKTAKEWVRRQSVVGKGPRECFYAFASTIKSLMEAPIE